jgi:hypothetical protein
MGVGARRAPSTRALSHFLQGLLNELDRHRPFADGRGDALDRAGPHVPAGEAVVAAC